MFKKMFIHSPLKYLISFILSLLVVVLYNVFNKGWQYVISYSNGFFISAVLFISVGALSWVDLENGFDIFRFIFVRKQVGDKRIRLADYSESRNEKNKNKTWRFTPYLVIGALDLILALIFMLVK